MSEISSIDSENSWEEKHEVLLGKPFWEKIGRVIIVFSSFSGFCAFVPALFQKKRSYHILSGPIGIGSQTLSQTTPHHSSTETLTSHSRETAENGREVQCPFDELICTPEERAKIEEIAKTVAEGNVFSLAASASHLRKLGNEIDHLHPFEFLHRLPKHHLKSIFESWTPMKKAQFMDGVKKGLDKENGKNNLTRYLDSFAAKVNTTPEAIRPLIRAADWEGLVHHLIVRGVSH